jgi:integrase
MPRKGERQKEERGIYRPWPGSDRYEIGYTDPATGRWRWEILPDGTGIKAARIQRAARMTQGAPAAPARDTFADVAEAYLAKKRRQVSPATIEGYQRALEQHINPTLGATAIAAIGPDDVAELVADWRERYAAWSVRTYWTPMVGVFGHALRRGIIAKNPCATLEKGERPVAGAPALRFLDGQEQIAALLAGAADDYWRLMFATFIFTGLRIGELLALQWADIDLREGFVHVTEQLRTDGTRGKLKTAAAARDVVLMPTLGSALRERRQADGLMQHPKRPVFASQAGHSPDRTTVRKYLKRACHAAGLQPLSPHALRHTYASILIVGQREDIVAVSRQLGHAKPSTTLDTYAKFFNQAAHAQRLRDGLDNQFGGLL